MNSATYKPQSWLMLMLSKILPAGIAKRFVVTDKKEYAARQEIEQLSEHILSKPCNKKTDKLRIKAKQAAKEVLNGAA